MKKKGNKILLFISFIAFISTGIYFLIQEINKTPSKPIIQKETLNIKYPVKEINWNNLLPEIKSVILEKFNDMPSNIEISIYKEIDLNNDKVNEVIINILNPSGAALENYVIFKFNKENKPEIVKLKDKDGNIKEEMFLQGIGGGGRYGFDFDFLPAKLMIYKEGFYAYNSPNDFCKVEAYVYKPLSDYFEYDEKISKELTENYCKKLCESVNEELKEYFINICK